MHTDNQDEPLLLECLASPWTSAFQLAMRVGIAPAMAEKACERLMLAGYLKCIQQHLSFLPPVLYAPVPAALELIAERWQVSPGVVAHRARMSDVRFQWLRATLEIAQEVNGLCSTLAQAKPDWRVCWETGIVRTYRGSPLVLHGRFGIHVPMPSGNERSGMFYLLIDRGQQKTLNWWRMIRYLCIFSRRDTNPKSKRTGSTFPPLLIITTHAYRAASLMRLAHKFNARMLLAASWDRDTLFTNGAHVAEWFTLARDEPRRVCLKPVHPFLTEQLYPSMPKHWPLRMIRPHAAKASLMSMPALDIEATWGKAISAVESLDDIHMQVLAFLCRHPLCPQSTLQALLHILSQQASSILQKLCEIGLSTHENLLLPVDPHVFGDEQKSVTAGIAQQMRVYGRCDPASTERRIAEAVRHGAQVIPSKNDDKLSQTARELTVLPLAGFWQATLAAIQLRAWREGRNTDAYVNAYAALCRERQGRPYHALAVYDFFERLQGDCTRYAAATRKMVGVNADYYEFITFQDELQVRTSFQHDGIRRYWCPDGYGVVRCGEHCTPFWLEIDGTIHTRGRPDAGVWMQKFDSLCAYFCSGDWTHIHPAFPILLIVTAQASIKTRLREILERTSNAHGISAPAVFMASRDAWLQRGPLAPIWMPLSRFNTGVQMDYAFVGAQQPGVLSQST